MRRFLFIIITALVVSTLHADFKVIGGISLSRYDVPPDEVNLEWNYKLGFSGGIGFEKTLTHRMLLELDVMYFQKGSKAKSQESPEGESNYKLNVVSVPALFRAKLLSASSPYILGGVEFSFVTSHDLTEKDQEPRELADNTKSFDFGYVLGGGFEIEIKEKLYFFLEGRYYHGVRNIMDDPLGVQNGKTRAFLIAIGFRS